jgi:hypothetical protein
MWDTHRWGRAAGWLPVPPVVKLSQYQQSMSSLRRVLPAVLHVYYTLATQLDEFDVTSCCTLLTYKH